MKKFAIFILAFLLSGGDVLAQDKVFKIYHDADYSTHDESAQAMQMGLRTALDEIGNSIQGYNLKLVKKDHRGNVVRSKLHMKQYLEDSRALFVLGGLHSPPYIKNREFINENGILLAVPWAAGGAITRYAGGTNWVFRLSVDDSKAGYRIAQYAVEQHGCINPHLLLEDTPWGASNKATMTEALEEDYDISPKVTRFGWNTKENQARVLLRNIANSGSDCVLFVGNSVEGRYFARAMLSLDKGKRLPIISHWGITGGDFHKVIDAEKREKLDLHFIQTCFSFVSSKQTDFTRKVFARARDLYPEKLEKPGDIPAMPGFVHAYDLGRLMVAAMQDIELTGNMDRDRAALRTALENLQRPVKGLVKTYKRPFKPFSPNNNDAHEALKLDDFCMGRYSKNNNVIVMPRKNGPDKKKAQK